MPLGKCRQKSSTVGVIVFPPLILEKKFSIKSVSKLQTSISFKYSGFRWITSSLRRLRRRRIISTEFKVDKDRVPSGPCVLAVDPFICCTFKDAFSRKE